MAGGVPVKTSVVNFDLPVPQALGRNACALDWSESTTIMQPATQEHTVWHPRANQPAAEFSDTLANEVAVALVYNGISHTVMMCSPIDLEDFAVGFSLTEGIINDPEEIYDIQVKPVSRGVEVHIELASRCLHQLKAQRRTLAGRTGCGICGTEQLQQVVRNIPPLPQNNLFDISLLDNVLHQLNKAQVLGAETGSTHAAAWISEAGELLGIREDVGRHVALDKLIGMRSRKGWYRGAVLVTSRASFEMVQKSAAAGIEILFAISAATTMAVELAEQTNLTLVGFCRLGRATVYTCASRLQPVDISIKATSQALHLEPF